jgi:predicted Zn-dependent protease
MKAYLKIASLFGIAVMAVLVLYVLRQASKPESAIIAAELETLARSKDPARAEKDPLYARDFEEKLQFLDYRLAVAYNSENRPDEAIVILERLIKGEETRQRSGSPRHSRSYAQAARYYDALIDSFELKGDDESAKKAAGLREEMLAAASERRKIEDQGEGKYIDLHAQ